MAVGLSDGTAYKDEGEWLVESHSTPIKTPVEGSVEPADALKPTGGGGSTGETSSTNFMGRLSMVNAFRGMANPSFEEDKKMLSGIWESAKKAFSLPGEVAQGNIDPSSPQAIERSADLAGFMIFGPAPVAKSMAEGTLGSFMGVTSKTFDKNKLAEAQIMKANGAHPDEIWNKTGTFQGVDNRWRQEINDSTAKLRAEDRIPWVETPVQGIAQTQLKNVLDHPELYKAYPGIENIKVHLNSMIDKDSAHLGQDGIHLGLNAASSKSTLLHEVQHAIQDREGFAKGGAEARNYALRFEDDLGNTRADLIKIQKRLQEGGKITEAEQATVDKATKLFELDRLRREAGKARAFENYLRLAGETEARNVETRMLLTGVERSRFHPQLTEDTLRRDQIVTDKPLWTTPYGATAYPMRAPE